NRDDRSQGLKIRRALFALSARSLCKQTYENKRSRQWDSNSKEEARNHAENHRHQLCEAPSSILDHALRAAITRGRSEIVARPQVSRELSDPVRCLPVATRAITDGVPHTGYHPREGRGAVVPARPFAIFG